MAEIRAGIYCRISLAAIGDTTKTDEQERISRELTDRLRWPVVEVYTDLSRSAWQRNRKRPDWDRMLADVDRGHVNALAIYHGDRLIRQPFDLELLLNLADTKGVLLASPSGTRDLGNADDRFILRIEAAMACRESDNTSRRKKAAYARMAREGITRPGGRGGRAFCFERDGITHRADEADLIREAARTILDGYSLGLVVRWVRGSGKLTTAGKPMSQNTLRRILVSPRVAGLMPDGEHQAAWQPVLDRPTWEALRGVLLLNQANPRAGRGALHLLSGIAVCGECGHTLWAGHNGDKPGVVAYRCPECHKVGRNAELLDGYVTGRVVGRLANAGNPEPELDGDEGAMAELAALQARRAETEAYIAGLADAPAGRIDVLNRALDGFDAKIAAVRDQLAGDGAARLRTRYAGISAGEFLALPLDVRRALVRGCYKVTVLRASGRGPGFRVQDVRLEAV